MVLPDGNAANDGARHTYMNTQIGRPSLFRDSFKQYVWDPSELDQIRRDGPREATGFRRPGATQNQPPIELQERTRRPPLHDKTR